MKNVIVYTIIGLIISACSENQNPDQSSNSTADKNKEIVSKALDGLFVQQDTGVISTYFAKDYEQHNPMFPSGRDVLYDLVGNLPPNFKFEPGLMLADDEFVMVHSRYSGLSEKPMIIVDIFKVNDGIITAHWDIAQEEVPADSTASKNPMFPIE